MRDCSGLHNLGVSAKTHEQDKTDRTLRPRLEELQASHISSVSSVLDAAKIRNLCRDWGTATVTEAIRAVQSAARNSDPIPPWSADPTETASHVERWLCEHRVVGYQPVFNLTGTILHTSLGRALLDPGAVDALLEAASRPIVLEYDLRTGKRGDRERPVRRRLCQLFGCESATVVNNNAAAVVLVLNTYALGREVLVSRGELIEIGGSFRLPEIMERSGCQLVEVGTTNRTRLLDYESRIGANTGLVFKALPSNYSIHGFTEQASFRELADMCNRFGLNLAVDLGSGTPVSLARFGLEDSNSPASLVRPESLVFFSGDKILGGPQCGIVLGSEDAIARLDGNPLKRAMRADKLALAALNATLRTLEDPEQAFRTNRFLQILGTPLAELRDRAERVAKTMSVKAPEFGMEVVNSRCQIGSGAHPERTVPGISLRINCGIDRDARDLAKRLRSCNPPILGRLHRHCVLLEMRLADPIGELVAALDTLP